jgi:hypothetical protein
MKHSRAQFMPGPEDIRLMGQSIEEALEKLILGILADDLSWPEADVSSDRSEE